MTPSLWRRYLGWLCVAVAAPVLLSHLGVLNETRALVVGEAACFAIAGLSLNMLTGYAGQISLGHFALLGTGAFVSSKLTAPTASHPVGAPFAVGVVAGVAAGALVAFLIGLPALRLRGLYLAVVTIVFNFVMVQSIFQSPWLSSGSGGVELPRPIVGGFRFVRNGDYVAIVLAVLVLVWLLDANLTASKLGRAFRAIRSDPAVAAAYGVDVTRYTLAAFTLSGAVAGLAGALYGHLFTFVNSGTFELSRSLFLLTLVVLGGLGSRAGVVVAAAAYGSLSFLLGELFGADAAGWIIVASAALLMFTIARHPSGLAGAWHEARRRRVRRRTVHGTDGGSPVFRALGSGTARAHAGPDARAGVPLLVARGVRVRFGGLVAVDGASLEVPSGRIVGLVGPNGAGKTTLFNVISGVLRPEQGRVEFRGQDISRLPAHGRAALGMGRTFQQIGLAKELSVRENLLVAQHMLAHYATLLGLVGLGRAPRCEAELRERAAATLAALGLERLADAPAGALSHGQQRILEIGCVLATGPELVMLDEPSAGMAPGAVENLGARLRDIRDELGRTVLLIEHNIPLVLDVCDELYVMAGGSVVARGDPGEVIVRPTVRAAYLGGVA